MKVVGNCPDCGNPIWASGPEDTKRTCFCIVTQRSAPITINPQPYTQPIYPWSVQPQTIWQAGTTGPPTQATANSFTWSGVTCVSRPPDEDGALVS